jgi:hypothetical protein
VICRFGNEFLFKNSCSHFIYSLLFCALRVSASLLFVLLMVNSVKEMCSIVDNILLMVKIGENKK